MDITITITPEISQAFSTTYNYSDTVTDDKGKEIPNPQTKEDFASSKIQEYVSEVYKSSQVKQRIDVAVEPLPTDTLDLTQVVSTSITPVTTPPVMVNQ